MNAAPFFLRLGFGCTLPCVLVIGLGQVVRAQSQAATRPAGGPLDVGTRRQVFIDNLFQENAKGIELRVHQPKKTGEFTMKPEHPWEQGGVGPYSSVLKEGDTYHMWYHVMSTVQWHTGDGLGSICYARSKDGIHWEKPPINLIKFPGSDWNNIVLGFGAGGVKFGQDGGMVFLDPTAPPEEKFRLAMRLDQLGEGIHVISSPDGIHWKPTHISAITARPQAKGHHLDSQNVVFWDARINKYVAYLRRNVDVPGSQGRSIARGESATLKGFPVVQDLPVVLGPDAQDAFLGGAPVVDYYMSAATPYAGAADCYVMFPTAYYHYIGGGILPEFKGDIPTNAGPLDSRFAASRDGSTWQRYNREAFVPLGMKGEFDWASTRVIWGVVPDVSGNYLYMYYRGSDWLHGWDRDERNKKLLTEAGLGASQNIAVLSRVVLRRDGFVSVRAHAEIGEFTTPALVFSGKQLVLNVDTSATGIAKVELQDEQGRALSGFSSEDCDLVHTANDVSRGVSWRGRSDVSSLAGRPVRLRFLLRDADLYAFQFVQ